MRILLILIAVLAISACKKNDTTTGQNPGQETLKHVPLEIGNYWVYQHFIVDTANGIEQPTAHRDSIVIDHDTTINNKKYVVRMGIAPLLGQQDYGLIDIIRDSSGYLVNETGTVLFAENNFLDTFNVWSLVVGNNDTIANVFYTMEPYLDDVSTPSGIYNGGLNYKGTVIQYKNDSSFTKYFHNIYVENVGKVLETTFFAGPFQHWTEIRLDHYHVQ